MTWLRRDTAELGLAAVQLGLTPEEAVTALTLGGRFQALGFTSEEISDMIRWQYGQWIEEERAVQEKTATVSQTRRWFRRKDVSKP